MKTNTPRPAPAPVFTAAGARAANITAEQQLRRLTATGMLWENNAYESGKSVVERIKTLLPDCRTEFVAACAVEARHVMHLRHMPLLIVREMARIPKHQHVVAKLLPDIISRADELAEFVAIYWKDGRQPLSAQVKKGLAASFSKFNGYQLAKYDRGNATVKLRDVAFLSHVKPWDINADLPVSEKKRQYKENGVVISEKLLQRHPDTLLAHLVGGTLPTPNTWETRLSSGEDKKEVFTDLLVSKKLGALAFLRNLRNMHEAGVDRDLIKSYSQTINLEQVLPFRYIAAARIVPHHEDMLEPMMLKTTATQPKLPGRTLLLVDVSASMNHVISKKSDMKRTDAANGLAILLREVCEEVSIFTFSSRTVSVPPRRGFALADAIHSSQGHSSTELGAAVTKLAQEGLNPDRIIIITDEQSSDVLPPPFAPLAYVINVGSEVNGVGYGPWTHIDGWSEGVLTYIQRMERVDEETSLSQE